MDHTIIFIVHLSSKHWFLVIVISQPYYCHIVSNNTTPALTSVFKLRKKDGQSWYMRQTKYHIRSCHITPYQVSNLYYIMVWVKPGLEVQINRLRFTSGSTSLSMLVTFSKKAQTGEDVLSTSQQASKVFTLATLPWANRITSQVERKIAFRKKYWNPEKKLTPEPSRKEVWIIVGYSVQLLQAKPGARMS